MEKVIPKECFIDDNLTNSIYNYPGAFRLPNSYNSRSGRPYTCREEFSKSFKLKLHKGFLFHASCSLKLIKKMIEWLENKLNLKNNCRTTVHRCSTKISREKVSDVYYVQLSPFWLDCRIRFNFFTIFIRSIERYSDLKIRVYDSPINILDSERYFNETSIATFLFLNGFTLPNKKKPYGWVHSLSFTKEKDIEYFVNRLRRPVEKSELVYFKDNKVYSNLTKKEKQQLLDWVGKNVSLRKASINKSQFKLSLLDLAN